MSTPQNTGRKILPNMYGLPQRPSDLQRVFEATSSMKQQQGPWVSQFAGANQLARDPPRLRVPRNVAYSQKRAVDVMSRYAHGLENTLLVAPPKFNTNINLQGQPFVPVDPYRMCPSNVSSRGRLGRLV